MGTIPDCFDHGVRLQIGPRRSRSLAAHGDTADTPLSPATIARAMRFTDSPTSIGRPVAMCDRLCPRSPRPARREGPIAAISAVRLLLKARAAWPFGRYLRQKNMMVMASMPDLLTPSLFARFADLVDAWQSGKSPLSSCRRKSPLMTCPGTLLARCAPSRTAYTAG